MNGYAVTAMITTELERPIASIMVSWKSITIWNFSVVHFPNYTHCLISTSEPVLSIILWQLSAVVIAVYNCSIIIITNDLHFGHSKPNSENLALARKMSYFAKYAAC